MCFRCLLLTALNIVNRAFLRAFLLVLVLIVMPTIFYLICSFKRVKKKAKHITSNSVCIIRYSSKIVVIALDFNSFLPLCTNDAIIRFNAH